jgi:methyl-accepting chemotaxis protein
MVALNFSLKRRQPGPVDVPPAAAAPAPDAAPAVDARTGDLLDLVEEDLRRSRKSAERTSGSMTDAIAAGVEGAGRIVAEAEQLADAIGPAVRHVDRLVADFSSIATAGTEIRAEIDGATRLAEEARSGADSAGSGVGNLAAAIDRIESVVGLISRVAKQTTLLALNATIEAERAGAAGRGFAVVATEVKALSVETQRATDEINRNILALQEAARETSGAVSGIVGMIERISPTFSAVAGAVERQAAIISEAARTSEEVRGFIDTVARRAESVQSQSAALRTGVESVRTAATEALASNDRATVRLMTVLRQSSAGDRRRHDRFPVSLDLTLRWSGGSLRTETVDISMGGLLAKANGRTIAAGTPIEADLAGTGTLRGRVVAMSPVGIHIAFAENDKTVADVMPSRIASVRAEYGLLIDTAMDTARRISESFESGIARAAVTPDDLFDTDYRPIPDTDPQQFDVRAISFLERTLQPIQEEVVKQDPRMTFCAAIDRNGYLPVHNLIYSKPQRRGDAAWNAANCRNKRIFDDRAGLTAGRNTRPFVIQAYNRDMGNGVTVLMKEVDAPIIVHGRHWGGFRTAYRM